MDNVHLQIKTDNFEQLLFNYKYYLAFENAHCQDYITEKAFYNALAHMEVFQLFLDQIKKIMNKFKLFY